MTADRHSNPPPDTDRHKGPNSKKKLNSQNKEETKNLSPSPRLEEEKSQNKTLKNYTTISTQCEIEMIGNPDISTDFNIAEKLEAIHDLIPQISSVIEKSEKNLEKAFRNVLKSPKVPLKVQDRAVSPIKNILGMYSVREDKKNESPVPKTPPNSVCYSNLTPDLQDAQEQVSTSSNSYGPHVGNLLLNIQNIKDNRYLLNGFQNELLQLKKDIENCRNCNGFTSNESDVNDLQNYCEKHAVFVPLLRMDKMGSKGDQIKLFNALITEAFLKKELENQIQHISYIERKLSQAKKSNDIGRIETLEKELELVISYFNNLMIKQQNERVLTEQQKIMKDSNEHECVNIINCDKCCLEHQIHDLLIKLRENVVKDIEDSKQRLQIQKMPNIDIRKPLQLQNILHLDIPPTSTPQISARSNFVYEAIIKNCETDDSYQNETIKTKILINKATSVEISASKNEVESTEAPLNMQHNRTKKSPKRFVKLQKTPSELGFRRTVGSQCDSNTSLMESIDQEPTPKVTVQTQTAVEQDDSLYLFGFKEYLTKEGTSPVKQVDVMLQVSLEGSTDTVVKSKSVGIDIQHSKNLSLSKIKNSDFYDVAVVAPRSEDPMNDEIQTSLPSSVSTEEVFIKPRASLRRASKGLQRIPSLKKMLIPPSSFTESQLPELEMSIQNPYVEPKYRMKRFSISKQDSDLEVKQSPGDIFYRSLTEKAELPERKALAVVESRPYIIKTSDAISTTTSSSYLENSSLNQKEGTKPKDKEQTVGLLVAVQNAGNPIIPKNSSIGDERETNEKESENLVMSQNKISENKDDDQNIGLLVANQRDRKAPFHLESKTEPKLFLDEYNNQHENSIKQTETPSKKSSSGGKLYRFVPDEKSFDELLENSIKQPETSNGKSISGEKLYRYVPDENNFDELLVNPIKVTETPNRKSASGEKLFEYISRRNSQFDQFEKIEDPAPFNNLIEAQSEPSERINHQENVPYNWKKAQIELFEHPIQKDTVDTDKEKSQINSSNNTNHKRTVVSDSEENQTKPSKKTNQQDTMVSNLKDCQTRPSKNTSQKQTVVSDLEETQTNPSENTKQEKTLVSNLEATETKPSENINQEDLVISDLQDSQTKPSKNTSQEETMISDLKYSQTKPTKNIHQEETLVSDLEETQTKPSKNTNQGDTVVSDLKDSLAKSSKNTNQEETIVSDLKYSQTKPSNSNNHQETIVNDLERAQSVPPTEHTGRKKLIDDKNESPNEATGNKIFKGIDSNIQNEIEQDLFAGFLERSVLEETKKKAGQNFKDGKNAGTSKNTVLPIFPPTYKLILNKNDFQSKLSDKNIILKYPNSASRKSVKQIQPPPLSSEKIGQINLTLMGESSGKNKESKKYMPELCDTDELIITNTKPYSKRDITSVTNYILPVQRNKHILDDEPCTSEFRSEISKISGERLKYSRRCWNIDKSVESSIVSSEGEVICNCQNLSAGQIHSCPRGKIDTRKIQSGINYKENLSSHLLLERERKHYNHWVTYYATKKYKDESSSSSSQSDIVNDN